MKISWLEQRGKGGDPLVRTGGESEFPDRAAEHRVLLDLQRAIMPAGLYVLPDVSMAAAYRPAEARRAAGGDWFDVVPVPGGALGLVVGDVVGYGADALAVMGQLRAVAAERLLSRTALADVMRALDRTAEVVPGARGATVCIGILDRLTGRLDYVTRGHPPPLVVTADGVPKHLPPTPGSPLALDGTKAACSVANLAPGDTLVLYSDGAVEHPARTVAAGMAELASRVGEMVRREGGRRGTGGDSRWIAEAVCGTVTGDLLGERAAGDDACVLAATVRLDPPAPLLLEVPAAVEQLGPVRQRLAGWLTGLGVAEEDLVSVELGVIEAVTNSVEHAYRDTAGTPAAPGTVWVEATLEDDGTVRVVVSDHGRWKPQSEDPGFRGRGLVMMRECMDEMRLDASAEGTRVVMARSVRHPLTRPRPRGPVPVAPAEDITVRVEAGPETVCISVGGVVDTAGVGQLRGMLLDAARTGTLPLTVDLDRVSLLSSAGLRLLYEQERRLAELGRTLRVIAAPGTPARDALAVGGLEDLLRA